MLLCSLVSILRAFVFWCLLYHMSKGCLSCFASVKQLWTTNMWSAFIFSWIHLLLALMFRLSYNGGLKQALIWSKMSTGLPIEIKSSMKGQNYVSFCRLDIDIHKYVQFVGSLSVQHTNWLDFAIYLYLCQFNNFCSLMLSCLILVYSISQKCPSCSFTWEKREQNSLAWGRNSSYNWGKLDNASCE